MEPEDGLMVTRPDRETKLWARCPREKAAAALAELRGIWPEFCAGPILAQWGRGTKDAFTPAEVIEGGV